MNDDPLDRLAGYRPTAGTVDAEWPAAERARTRAGVLAAHPARALRFRPARRAPRALAPLGAGAAVLALIAGVLVLALDTDHARSADGPGAGAPHRLTSTGVPTDGQFAYRYNHQIDLDDQGHPVAGGPDELRDRSWVAPDGEIVSAREGSQTGCQVFGRQGDPSLQEPTRDFLAGLPTNVGDLTAYLREHVSGSSSRDEAVFVAVGDALRTGDLLATSDLRAALVGVLGATPGVTVHPEQTDYLGRAATRVDFVNEQTRPGEVQSLYFDPATYQLLEERDAASGGSVPQDQPSPAYDAAPSGDTSTPEQLTGAAYVNVMVEERVVDTIPFDPAGCAGLRIDGRPLGGSRAASIAPGPGH